MERFRTEFDDLALEFQKEVKTTVAEQLDKVRETLDSIRSQNVATESEQDRVFRRRVAPKLAGAEAVMERITAVVDSLQEQT